jgi:two-component system, NarL family, response regulator NreC
MKHPISISGREEPEPTGYPYRVVLADNDGLYRHVLKGILEAGRSLEVSGEAGDGLQLLSLLSSIPTAPQMAIVDISMPKLGGIGATSKIKSAYPLLKVLIVSIHMEKEYVREALDAGADGYILKEGADSELFLAIETIRRGGIYISPVLMRDEVH